MSLPVISVVGSKFYDSNGDQFFIKGVVYAPDSDSLDDILTRTDQCKLDAALMHTLGVNTIRVYLVDPKGAHDGCMEAFADARIYVMIALDGPAYAINRSNPSWTIETYNQYTAVMDSFAEFNNVLGFFGANEVINDGDFMSLAPFIKGIIADLKKYRDSRGYRGIPIGYSNSDITSLRRQLHHYLACGNDNPLSIDFFSMNNYTWCDQSTMSLSGYDKLIEDAAGYNIPIVLSETACISAEPRTFGGQAAIFGADMNQQFSGVIIYQWALMPNGCGLVHYSKSYNISGTPTPVKTDFNVLRSRWATLAPTGTPSSIYTPSGPPPACPSSTSGTKGWAVDARSELPTLGLRLLSAPQTTTRATQNISYSTITIRLPTSSRTTLSSIDQGGGPKPSVGMIAGITIGVAAIFILIAALIILRVLRSRHKKKQSITKQSEYDHTGLEVGGVGTFPPKPELAATSSTTTDRFRITAVATGIRSHKDDAVLTELPNNEVSQTSHLVSAQESNSSPTTVSPITFSPNLANTPWIDDAGRSESGAAKVLAQKQSDEQTEIRRLEEEERRIDNEIAEYERLRKLQEEKAVVRAKLAAARVSSNLSSGNGLCGSLDPEAEPGASTQQ